MLLFEIVGPLAVQIAQFAGDLGCSSDILSKQLLASSVFGTHAWLMLNEASQ